MAEVEIYANLWMAAASAALVTCAGAWVMRLRNSLTRRVTPGGELQTDGPPIDAGELAFELEPDGRLGRIQSRFAPELDPPVTELSKLVLAEDQPVLENALGLLSAKTPEIVVELRVHARDGALHWQRWTVRARFHGERADGYTCIARDVTREKDLERKLADQTRVLERMERALLKERELCSEIVAACPAFLVLLDPEDRIARVNRSMSEALGHAEQDLIGRSFWASLAPDVAHAERSFELQDPLGGQATELRLRSAERRVHLVDWRWRVLRDAQGQRRFRLGVGIDVTERRREEDWLATQHQQLVEADRMIALGTLISGLAHEISNPNQVIQINVPLLDEAWTAVRREPPVDSRNALYREVPQMLQEVLAASDRIQFIVRELNAYGRGETQCAMGPVDLNEVVHSGLTLIASTLRRATRRFSVRYAENLPPVRGNLRRLEQVLINLMLNACQALTDPQQGLHVETALDEERREVVLSVRDEGVGIRKEDLGRILDPFFTTKRQQGGTGLGLAIARHIAERHGGRIELESEIGKGTVARLCLPVLRGNLPGSTPAR